MVKPLTVTGEVLPDPVKLPVLQVAVYSVIGLPPLLAGAVKAIEACISEPLAAPMVGAFGAIALIVTLCVTCSAAL